MRYFSKIWLTGVFLLFISTKYIVCQINEYNIEVFTIENGLSQSYTNIIFLDSKGFLWIGTKDGVNKYNGYSFEKYRNEPTDSLSLINNYITAISEDRDGNIWIGTKGGLSKYDRNNDLFTNYTHIPINDNSLSSNEVFDLLVDRNNNLWVKTKAFVDKFDSVSNGFIHIKHYNSLFSVVPSEKSFPLLESKTGTIYIGTKDGLQVYSPNNKSLKRYYYESNVNECISNNVIKCMELDNDGTIWVGTEFGLNAFNPLTQKFKNYYFNNKSKFSNQINDVYIDSEDNLWVATNDGLILFDKHSGKYKVARNLEGARKQVIIREVYSILEDNSKILWLTTPEGLIKIDKKPRKLYTIKFPTNDRKIFNLDATALLIDRSNNLWIGSSGNGIKICKNTSNRKVQFENLNSNLNSYLKGKTVYSIFQDKFGVIWIGTDNGLYTFNPKSNVIREFCKQSIVIPCSLFENRSVYSIIEDADGDIWFGTSRGVHVYDRGYEIVKSTYRIQNKDVVEIENVYALHQDKRGNIWIGCDEGLIKYNKKRNFYYHYGKESINSSFRILGGTVYSIYEDNENLLWLGTSYGLQTFHPDSGIIARYSIVNSLPNNNVYSIESDKRGDLWLSTNKGICHFSPRTGVVRNFDIRDGLQGYEFNIGSSCKGEKDHLFFGGVQGVNCFYPDSIKLNLNVPPVEITTIEIFGSKHRERHNIEGREELEIPYGKYTFNIYFAALDYTYPERNQYAYKMLLPNEEEDWIFIGNHDYASFSNISAGEYIFHVIGSNSDNVWNYNGQQIKIVVKPPYWRTTIAYISYIIIAFIIINIFLRLRTRSLRSANRILRDKELAAIQIAKQKEELSVQNKNIRDSINYARRIQQAILPSEKVFRSYIPDSFIYYKPKDIVSGDFYWIQEIQDKIFLAAVDCTGHGVPGAFMSIIGYELFRRLRAFRNFDDPAKILLKLNDDFGEIFKDIENISLKDGMDVALCIIDRYSKTIKFAGAFSPFYIVRDDKVIEIKGDRYSVGVDELNLERPHFTTHHIDMKPDDIYYIFSDGYADQFGGPEGKKYKFRRFRHLLLSIYNQPFDVQKYLLEESMVEWQGEHEQVDDIMVIGFKLKT